MSTNVNRSQDIAELDPMTFEQLDQATQIENNDIFVIDQPDATRKVLYTDVKTKILSEDGSNLTVNYDVVDTVENIAPGETIGTMFKKISSWFISKISQLGTLAFKDKVSESDLDSAYISTITGHLNDTVLHSTSTEKELWNDKYTKAEIDEKLGLIEQPEIPVASTEVNGLMSKESVVELSRLGDSVSQLNSDLNTHMSYKVQRIGIRNYSINTDYPIQPLDIPRIGLVIPTYGSINTFSYNTLMFVVERDATTIKLQRMFKNDGSMVSSGNVDIDIILFPVW